MASVDGGSYAPLTPVNNQEGAPTWSPDGGQVAFGGMTQPPARTTGQLVIHILRLKTHQLSDVPGSEGLWRARWSPDGRYIAALTEDSQFGAVRLSHLPVGETCHPGPKFPTSCGPGTREPSISTANSLPEAAPCLE